MSWRVAKISGTTGGSWRVIALSGSVVKGAAASSWRLLKLSGVVGGGWRVLNISGSVTQSSGPVLAPIATQTVDPVQTVTIVAQVTNGVTPDSYSFTSPGIALTVSGNTATFLSPGSSTGGTVTVTVTATKGANTSSPQTASVIVNATSAFYKNADGTLHAMSYPYQQS